MLDNGDDLDEEYNAGGVYIESRSIAGERLAPSFELSRHESSWKDGTLAAVGLQPNGPLYEHRTTVTPQVTVAFTPHLHVTGGISASELGPFADLNAMDPLGASQVSEKSMANAFWRHL